MKFIIIVDVDVADEHILHIYADSGNSYKLSLTPIFGAFLEITNYKIVHFY